MCPDLGPSVLWGRRGQSCPLQTRVLQPGGHQDCCLFIGGFRQLELTAAFKEVRSLLLGHSRLLPLERCALWWLPHGVSQQGQSWPPPAHISTSLEHQDPPPPGYGPLRVTLQSGTWKPLAGGVSYLLVPCSRDQGRQAGVGAEQGEGHTEARRVQEAPARRPAVHRGPHVEVLQELRELGVQKLKQP